MNAQDLQDLLIDAVASALHDEGLARLDCTRSYEESGVLTYDKGIVVKLDDGSEYALTIVQSR